jgi:hypothetical protein
MAKRLMLSATSALSAPIMIPARWRNNAVGVFLVPVAWVLTEALFTTFAHAAKNHAFWATEEFWFFMLGAAVWTLAFLGSIWVFGGPRPLRLYVLGHELTHAIWAKAMGGKVYAFDASREGGYVVTDTHNFWIALSPYFHPLYSILTIALYGVASLFYDLTGYTPVLFGLLGLTWAFHFSFTLWMIPKGQSDLSVNGTCFSLVLIYLMNLMLLSALLIFAAPEVTFEGFWDEVERHAIAFSDTVLAIFNAALRALLLRLRA